MSDREVREVFAEEIARILEPVAQPLRTGLYGYRLATGKRQARGVFDVAGGLFHGQTKQQPSNVGTLIQDAVSGDKPGTGPPR